MIKSSTNIYGLSFEKRYGNSDDDKDWIDNGFQHLHQTIKEEFSANNKKILLECINKLKNKKSFNSILEIGVNRSRENSSTQFIFQNKPQETKYVGVDANCILINEVYNPDKNIFGICSYSQNFDTISNYLNELNISELDLIIIDGWHSINQLYLDFQYTKYISKNGIVFFHDTNYHPGPKVLLECINNNIFNVYKFFENEIDWGVAYIEKI